MNRRRRKTREKTDADIFIGSRIYFCVCVFVGGNDTKHIHMCVYALQQLVDTCDVWCTSLTLNSYMGVSFAGGK